MKTTSPSILLSNPGSEGASNPRFAQMWLERVHLQAVVPPGTAKTNALQYFPLVSPTAIHLTVASAAANATAPSPVVSPTTGMVTNGGSGGPAAPAQPPAQPAVPSAAVPVASASGTPAPARAPARARGQSMARVSRAATTTSSEFSPARPPMTSRDVAHVATAALEAGGTANGFSVSLDASAQHLFFLAPKQAVETTRTTRPPFQGGRCHVLCPSALPLELNATLAACESPAARLTAVLVALAHHVGPVDCGSSNCAFIHLRDVTTLVPINMPTEFGVGVSADAHTLTAQRPSGREHSVEDGEGSASRAPESPDASAAPTFRAAVSTPDSNVTLPPDDAAIGASWLASVDAAIQTVSDATARATLTQWHTVLSDSASIFEDVGVARGAARMGKKPQLFRVRLSALAPTSGLLFACALSRLGELPSFALTACEFFSARRCRNGARCLYAHCTDKSALVPIKSVADVDRVVDAATPLSLFPLALPVATPTSLAVPPSSSPAAHVADMTLEDCGVRTMGDLQALSAPVFEALTRRLRNVNLLQLQALREFDLAMPLPAALQMFHGVTPESIEAGKRVAPVLGQTVRDLIEYRNPRHLLSLPLPLPILTALEKIRARLEAVLHEADGPHSITLRDVPPGTFFSILVEKICSFRTTHAHKSWRKQDASRPVVTSVITYVDPELCHCRNVAEMQALQMQQSALAALSPAPLVSSSGRAQKCQSLNPSASAAVKLRSDPMRSFPSSPAAAGHATVPPPDAPALPHTLVDQQRTPPSSGMNHLQPATPSAAVVPAVPPPDWTPHPPTDAYPLVPPSTHWCRCPRGFEIGVNYELSTPSGSRCSEQNVLGKIAATGLPTHCIREVFVHGSGVKEDPNPLFPCGVCENMLRKISEHVEQEHGGDIMLYMFDQKNAPRKLVSMPVKEISHRAGTTFRRFVEEDLRGE